jgi:hypothetical protein
MAPRVQSGVAEEVAREWRGRRLGFGAEGETVWLENGDGGGDSDSFLFYVAIKIPQMPLSKIDGMVNLIFMRRARQRYLIFSACWWHCSAS